MHIFTLAILLLMLFVLYKWNQHRVRKYRENLINRYRFPQKIYDEVGRKYPHLDDNQIKTVIACLRNYFLLCNDANRRFVSMPSQVVDVAWHEFILFTRDYQHFCKRALGRFLHHTPAEAMPGTEKPNEGIRRAWKLACRRENINPAQPTRLPKLFAIDALFEIEDGFKYDLDCQKPGSHPYCAGHLGCGGSCGASCGGDSGSDAGGCGGGCGGD